MLIRAFVGVLLAGCPSGHSLRDVGVMDAGAPCLASCPPNTVCFNGACVDPCAAAGEQRCDGGCVALASDRANCGACGFSCAEGETCVTGSCQATPLCPAALRLCPAPTGDGGLCADLRNDPMNCGSCGRSCAPGFACIAGMCPIAGACPQGLLFCPSGDAGVCVNAALDDDNCGGCAISCGVAGVCSDGGCACAAGFTSCAAGASDSGSCVNLDESVQGCGACGARCLACEICASAVCAPQQLLVLDQQTLEPDAGYFFLVASGDFNGDGLPDLVAETGFGPTTLAVAFALGDGGFVPFQTEAQLPDDLAAMVVADFNRDGFDDVAVTTGPWNGSSWQTLSLTILYGSSAGLITGSSAPIPSTGLGYAAAGDLDHDGWPDLVLTSSTSSEVDVYWNLTDGGFAESSLTGPQPDGGATQAPVIADADGDGLVDLVFAESAGPPQVIYRLRDGGFALPASLPGAPSVNILVPFALDGGAATFFGVGASGFGLISATGSAPVTSAPVDFGISGALVEDVNHDGLRDVVLLGATSFLASGLAVMLQNRDGGWDPGPPLWAPELEGWLWAQGDVSEGLLSASAGRIFIAAPDLPGVFLFDEVCP